MTTPVLHEPSAPALTVNGETRAVAPGTTLAASLQRLEDAEFSVFIGPRSLVAAPSSPTMGMLDS